MITEKKVYEVISKCLEVDRAEITASTTMDDFEAWSSLNHLSILVALDEHLDGKASKVRDLAEADSVELIIRSLKQNQLIRM